MFVPIELNFFGVVCGKGVASTEKKRTAVDSCLALERALDDVFLVLRMSNKDMSCKISGQNQVMRAPSSFTTSPFCSKFKNVEAANSFTFHCSLLCETSNGTGKIQNNLGNFCNVGWRGSTYN